MLAIPISKPSEVTSSASITLDRVANLSEYKRPDRLTCQLICSELLVNPVRCKGCSTHFCKQCIEQWIKKNNTCPNCRERFVAEKSEKTLLEIGFANIYTKLISY